MKLAILSLVAGSAAAFAPASKTGTSPILKASPYENEIGVIAPTGFFDPLGLSKKADPETFARWRETELVHGRVAQLAVIGYVVQEVYRWPGTIDGTLKFADIPNGLKALDAIPSLGWAQIFFLIGLVQVRGVLGNYEVGKPDLSPEILAKRQLQELQHGRLAMLAIMELLRHDYRDGADGLEGLITGLPFLG